MSLKLGQYLKHLGIPKTSPKHVECLKHLERLKKLESLKKLERLKKLESVMPAEKVILRVTVDLIAVNLDMAAVTGTAVFL